VSYSAKLPSGMSVTFREPYNKDRQAVINMIKPQDKVAVDEVLAGYCLETIEGRAFTDPDPRFRMDTWTIKDSQYYVQLWLEMFTVGDEDMKRIRELGKQLLAPASATDSE